MKTMTKHTELDATAVHVKALAKILDAHTAEYIVRACNAFPAREALLDTIKEVASMAGIDWLHGQLLLCDAIEEYEAAKATG